MSKATLKTRIEYEQAKSEYYETAKRLLFIVLGSYEELKDREGTFSEEDFTMETNLFRMKTSDMLRIRQTYQKGEQTR